MPTKFKNCGCFCGMEIWNCSRVSGVRTHFGGPRPRRWPLVASEFRVKLLYCASVTIILAGGWPSLPAARLRNSVSYPAAFNTLPRWCLHRFLALMAPGPSFFSGSTSHRGVVARLSAFFFINRNSLLQRVSVYEEIFLNVPTKNNCRSTMAPPR